MDTADGTQGMIRIHEHLDRLYAELAELRREAIVNSTPGRPEDQENWQRLVEASKEISARWTGLDAVDEIRTQREK